MEAGANQRVTTDSGIVLDFAGLFGDSVEQKRPSKTPPETILEGKQYKTITELEKPVETPPEGLGGQQAKGKRAISASPAGSRREAKNA